MIWTKLVTNVVNLLERKGGSGCVVLLNKWWLGSRQQSTEACSYDGYCSPVKRARIESVRCTCLGACVVADGSAVVGFWVIKDRQWWSQVGTGCWEGYQTRAEAQHSIVHHNMGLHEQKDVWERVSGSSRRRQWCSVDRRKEDPWVSGQKSLNWLLKRNDERRAHQGQWVPSETRLLWYLTQE